ncbi:MAG: NAD(P)/FAD-dependent oxidoreductase [Chloroflexi bacterium]|nr:NAD(P)/FAD-dependent oxidoreductase [Chloroflexota bacterium]MDA1239745.1 NAD(P)/FAD-dependent oxidoreductase [Chloroflexota bacterium]
MTSDRADAPVDAEVVVIGAGAVGLAVAERLARDRSVIVVEAHEGPARETSSHNSGVVHASIYYPTGSLKHRLCLEGNAALYEWCESRHVPIRRTGKLIAAFTPEEIGGLDDVYQQATQNEARSIERIGRAQIDALEPNLLALEAVWSPSTGVVDAFAYARSLESAARGHGALFAYHHRVTAIERISGGFRLTLADAGGAETTLACAAIVNSAGLYAPEVAALAGYPLDGDAAAGVPVLRQTVNRGRYYDVIDPAAARAVTRPVYPLPEHAAGGLGLHLTVDVEGGAHLGPSTEWIDPGTPLDYRHPETADWRVRFLEAGQRYIPGLRDDQIAPGQVGYRPKLQQPGQDQADFLIWHDRGFVHLGGIESPGLTSSLPLAREVAAILS